MKKVSTPKLSPLAQSVVDQIAKLDAAGKLTKDSKVSIAVTNSKTSAQSADGLDDADIGAIETGDDVASATPSSSNFVDGVVDPAQGRIGVYSDDDGDEAPEGSMLAEILKAVTKKVAAPPLRNSAGRAATVKMMPGAEEV